MYNWIFELHKNSNLINSIIPELRSIGVGIDIIPDNPLYNPLFLLDLLNGGWKNLLTKILIKYDQLTDIKKQSSLEILFIDICQIIVKIPFPYPHGLKKTDLIDCFRDANISEKLYSKHLNQIYKNNLT